MAKPKSKYKFSPENTKAEGPSIEDLRIGGVKEAKVKTAKLKKKVVQQIRDPRLDELVPLIVDILSRLLGSAGMLRYRTDFVEKVKEVMDGEEK